MRSMEHSTAEGDTAGAHSSPDASPGRVALGVSPHACAPTVRFSQSLHYDRTGEQYGIARAACMHDASPSIKVDGYDVCGGETGGMVRVDSPNTGDDCDTRHPYACGSGVGALRPGAGDIAWPQAVIGGAAVDCATVSGGSEGALRRLQNQLDLFGKKDLFLERFVLLGRKHQRRGGLLRFPGC